ncbi:hypothetical protein PHA51_07585 [Rodentibacter pneumotropicus]|uniref:hypothetical protein n=1 Tax=Rodentibacter TaxID=1960084 RepID=UPI0022490E12|nr:MULTISPECIES: hypothetical protein [Rodentibacter]MCX2960967.1 hypothetical protein [Rodentibacter heylii]MDC2825889.1 hypothetical protein [Rodentibacter pneumotropicus]
MMATYLPLPTLSRKTTYENVMESVYLLRIYQNDLLDLRDYLRQRIQSSPGWADILHRLNTEIAVASEKAEQDAIYLDSVDAFNMAKKYDEDDVIPWYFFRAPSICRRVLNRTHPLVKLYDKYEYLFVEIEKSEGYISYSPRKLF